MTDEMFFSNDSKSLRRGKRVSGRTEACRPCRVWPKDEEDLAGNGVILDINPYGMRIRMLEFFPAGTNVLVQLMRDDEFKEPLAAPLDGVIVRCRSDMDGFSDVGVQLIRKHLERPATPIVRPTRRPSTVERPKPRMHTIDFTVGGQPRRRTEK